MVTARAIAVNSEALEFRAYISLADLVRVFQYESSPSSHVTSITFYSEIGDSQRWQCLASSLAIRIINNLNSTREPGR